MKKFAKIVGLLMASAIAIFFATFFAIRVYLDYQADFRYSLKNVTQKPISEAYVIIGNDEIYNFGRIEPGDSAEVKFPPPEDSHHKIIVKFASGRTLSLEDPVYGVAGDKQLLKFEIHSDNINLVESDLR